MHKLDIVNVTLTTMGLDPIVSLDDANSNIVKFVNVIYPFDKKFCLALHNWNFAQFRKKLNQLAENEQSDKWQYAYGEPSDILKIVSLRDSLDNFVDYEEMGNVIYANKNPVYLTYIADVSENYFTEYFVEVLKYKLACDLSVSVLRDFNAYKNFYELYQITLKTARGLDSARGKVNKRYNTLWLEGL